MRSKLKPIYRQPSKISLFIFIAFFSIGLGLYGVFVFSEKTKTADYTPTKLTGESYVNAVTRYKDLLSSSGSRSALETLAVDIEQDKALANTCHPIAHSLGQQAYEYYGSPVKALEYQSAVCNSGYGHGVIEAYFSSLDMVNQQADELCKAAENAFGRWQCYHGVGHGLMYFTNNDLWSSIDYCNGLEADGSHACINGVFMENFSGNETMHVSAFVSTDSPRFPCEEVAETYKGECYLYAPVYYLQMNKSDYRAALRWCRKAEKAFEATCISGIGSQFMKDNFSDTDKLLTLCSESGNTFEVYCVAGAYNYLIFHYGEQRSAAVRCPEFQTYESACLQSISSEPLLQKDSI